MPETRELTPEERKKMAEIFSKMAELASKDKDFKNLCLSDTAAAFKKFTGVNLPDTLKVEFVKSGEECGVIGKAVPIPLEEEGGISKSFVNLEEVVEGKIPPAMKYMPPPPVNRIVVDSEVESVTPRYIELPGYGETKEVNIEIKTTLTKYPVMKYMAPPNWKIPDVE